MFSAIAIALLASVSYAQTEMPCFIAYPIDTSGSMADYSFDKVKEALVGDIGQISEGDINYIIPFAENELAVKRITYDDTDPGMQDAKSFINNLSATGQFTHLEEGCDSAVLALLDEPGEAVRVIILISDGISDPGPNHKRIQLEELSSRIPAGIKFYLVDPSEGEYPGFHEEDIGGFTAYTKPGLNLTVFPVSSRLPELFSVLRAASRPSIPEATPEQEVTPESKHRSRSMILFAVMGIGLLVVLGRLLRRVIFRGKASDDSEETREGRDQIRMLSVRAGDIQRRFPAPVTFTVGGGKRDDIQVQGAMNRELTVRAEDDTCSYIQKAGLGKKDEGRIFRAQEFSLSIGTLVSVSLESDKERLHRYVKEVR
jgi:hypothetical protein